MNRSFTSVVIPDLVYIGFDMRVLPKSRPNRLFTLFGNRNERSAPAKAPFSECNLGNPKTLLIIR